MALGMKTFCSMRSPFTLIAFIFLHSKNVLTESRNIQRNNTHRRKGKSNAKVLTSKIILHLNNLSDTYRIIIEGTILCNMTANSLPSDTYVISIQNFNFIAIL
ncbi:hypothetical protein ACOME3_009059 [Neoechinorhynchus agilis]